MGAPDAGDANPPAKNERTRAFDPKIPLAFALLGVLIISADATLSCLPPSLGCGLSAANASNLFRLALLCLFAAGIIAPTNVIMTHMLG